MEWNPNRLVALWNEIRIYGTANYSLVYYCHRDKSKTVNVSQLLLLYDLGKMMPSCFEYFQIGVSFLYSIVVVIAFETELLSCLVLS